MRYNEYVMTSLRTLKGCDISYIPQHLGNDYVNYLYKQLKNVQTDYYMLTKKTLLLSEKGRLFADFVASSLFI
jgi:oxygen-independent coproporphyrinogen-3 oxidase